MNKSLRLLPFLLVIACGKSGPAPEAPKIQDVPVQVEATGEADPIASPDAVTGGTFTTWGGGFPKSLNFWLDTGGVAGTVSGLMFESLVELHSTEDRPVAGLAESWEISPDKKTYTFKINPAAKWSDGQPITAADIQFYYDVIMDPKNLTSPFRVDLSRFSRPEIVDDHTVRITAKEAHWKNFWAAAGLTAFPKHVWEGKDFNSINFDFPVVSGPYALDEVKMNRSVSLKRRGDWWGRVMKYNQHKFNFDYLVFKATEDRTKALEVLKKGEYDAYPIYTAQIWAQQTNFPQVQKNWVIRQNIYNRTPRSFQGLALNMRQPFFQDPRVRRALALLLDRELMNQKLMFNQYFLLNSYYPQLYPGNVNPDLPVVKFDPDQARALLKEAGWEVGSDGLLAKNGAPLEISILHVEEQDMRHLNIYMEQLRAVGIKVSVEVVSPSTFTKRVDNHEFQMIWAAFGADRLPDPEGMWSSKVAGDVATLNYPGLQDAEIDRLIDAQKLEMDLGKRNEILKQIDKRLMEISPYVLLWQSASTRLLYWNRYGTPKYVLGKYGDEGDALAYWWYDPAKARALDDAMQHDTALPAQPAEVHYGQ